MPLVRLWDGRLGHIRAGRRRAGAVRAAGPEDVLLDLHPMVGAVPEEGQHPDLRRQSIAHGLSVVAAQSRPRIRRHREALLSRASEALCRFGHGSL